MRSPTLPRLPIHAIEAAPHAPVRTRTFVGPFIVLVGIVCASATQTEFASYLAQTLDFDKPYFSFFVTHSAFTFVFPVHLAVLSLRNGPRGAPARAKQLLRNLRTVLGDQLQVTPRWRQLWRPLNRKILPLTGLISFPAIAWFVAMALSPAMDITAIYATSAFHTYFFSLILLGTPLTRITVIAIAVAFGGVLVLTLDGAGGGGPKGSEGFGGRRVVGDIIMVIGAALLGLYEVVYKMVLPEGEGGTHLHGNHPASPVVAHYASTPNAAAGSSSQDPETATDVGDDDDDDDDDDRIALDRPAGSRTPLLPKTTSSSSSSVTSSPPRSSYPASPVVPSLRTPVPHLPTALLSNFLTSAIGFATFVCLWVPFPFLHMTGVEEFVWPHGSKLWSTLFVVASGGAIYNAGLMTLIGIWGPTVASVANLLTIGLVAVMDAVWMGRIPDLQTIGGAGLICGGFAALLWEGDVEG